MRSMRSMRGGLVQSFEFRAHLGHAFIVTIIRDIRSASQLFCRNSLKRKYTCDDTPIYKNVCVRHAPYSMQ
jgi:hypothetical protein